jgi:CRP/FNR family transcriptional regulator, cyclic AMP receptor protein
MSIERTAQLLGRTQIFAGLDDEQLLSLAQASIRRSYLRGESIFHQGDPGEALFAIADGLVKIVLLSEDGNEMVLATLASADTFGELALIDGGPRSASARAIEATTVFALPRDSFLHAVRDNPRLLESLHQSLGTLLRSLLAQASDLVFMDLAGRVAKLLVALADKEGKPEDGGIKLDLHLSQSGLAGMVGGSRPSVNQILKSFEARGYLEVKGRHIFIKHPESLRRRAGI